MFSNICSQGREGHWGRRFEELTHAMSPGNIDLILHWSFKWLKKMGTENKRGIRRKQ